MQRGCASANREIERLVVLTVGHSNHTLEAFLELLRAHGVGRVVDVRTIPRSLHNPQFNRETLPAKLRAASIGYVHLAKLGGLRRARRDSPNTGWHNSSFRGFADYMQTPDFETGLQRLIKLAEQKRSALLCAEAVPWRQDILRGVHNSIAERLAALVRQVGAQPEITLTGGVSKNTATLAGPPRDSHGRRFRDGGCGVPLGPRRQRKRVYVRQRPE